MSPEEDRAATVGEIRGELRALKERMDRHESFVGEALRRIGEKLDTISTQISQGVGISRAMLGIVGVGGTICGAIISPVIARILHS